MKLLVRRHCALVSPEPMVAAVPAFGYPLLP
jgi:hypothetical protein